jgi:hypothetical protein
MSDNFDRVIGALDGLPDVTKTRPTTIASVLPMLGNAQTFIVQTYRQRESGDTIFLQVIDADGSDRMVIPPKVAAAIARQHDALTTMVRRQTSRRLAEERAERGEVPAFLRKKAQG